jgi:hypothetical protein
VGSIPPPGNTDKIEKRDRLQRSKPRSLRGFFVCEGAGPVLMYVDIPDAFICLVLSPIRPKAAVIGEDRKEHSSSIRLRVGLMPKRSFAEVDHKNATGEWNDSCLRGTQPGPNEDVKNW